MAIAKTYHNPVNGEDTTILESADTTNGEYTHFEVRLRPGGGNPIHYHTKFTEEFFAVQGTLGLYFEGENIYLQPGENKLVPVAAHHRFFNDTKDDIVFRVVLRKGQPDFEKFLVVMFGLVNDGKTITKNQIPLNIFTLAVMYGWGDTHLTNPLIKLLSPVIKSIGKFAVQMGRDKALTDKYCR
jgi:mannose-6-phosphate isomerase-like protein (cupin superfamily)